jgi:hypothetical protein
VSELHRDHLLAAANTKRGCLQRRLREMLRAREHQPDALPTSVRFLFYELVQLGIVPKQRRSKVPRARGRRADQDMAEAVFLLRDRGLIPWDWIADETRTLENWRCVADSGIPSIARALICGTTSRRP